jgi:pimeloyl-ACP methyl ester carboxylesterase
MGVAMRHSQAPKLALLIFAAAYAALVSCKTPQSGSARPSDANTTTAAAGISHYERNDKKARVIVFVHGIFGSAKDTWTCQKGDFNWPKALLSDPAFTDSDVYVAAYDTPYFGNRMTIDEVVSNLANRFQSDGVFSHREVVFVAHSLGGLIVQRFLLTHREFAKQVPLIMFYSTPETGAQVAHLGHIFSADPLLKEMFPNEQNDYLLNLENEWIGANFTIKRYCAYEKKPTKGIWVVDRLSGTRNCTNKTPIPINKDHIEIVKPCSTQDDAYIVLKNVITENPIAPPPVVTKDEVVTRNWNSPQLDVGCNQTNSGTLQAAVPLDPQLQEKVISVTASYTKTDNIKGSTGPTVVGGPASAVSVTYGFNGQDKEWTGNCPGGGHAYVVVTFTISRKVPVQ